MRLKRRYVVTMKGSSYATRTNIKLILDMYLNLSKSDIRYLLKNNILNSNSRQYVVHEL